jgi:hypothetical protein
MSAPPSDSARSAFQPWHLFVLLAMAAATVAVVMARDTHPAALLLLSAAVISSGLVAWALFNALAGFLGVRAAERNRPLQEMAQSELQREKALVLRALKELDFDKAMGKVSDEDFAAISGPLRRRAMALIEDLERTPASAVAAVSAPAAPHVVERAACAACGTSNERDSKYCKACGGRL